MFRPNYTVSTARFSDPVGSEDPDSSSIYRYELMRSWGASPCVLWILLNPSTATATKLDPTLRRCQEFTHRWGYETFSVCNLYAFRSKNPDDLWQVQDPVGPDNDKAIADCAASSAVVVVGWGSNASKSRQYEIMKMLERMNVPTYCLGMNSNGSPRHPLYIHHGTALEPWPRGRTHDVQLVQKDHPAP